MPLLATRFRRAIGMGCCVLLLGLALFGANSVKADGISIDDVTIDKGKSQFQLNARIAYSLTDEVLEALKSGVAITLLLSIEIERLRPFIWNEHITSITQHHVLQYHALSDTYILKNPDAETQQSYLSLNVALQDSGVVNALPLIPISSIDTAQRYQVKLKSEIDVDALPAPLRPVAHISSDWNINSEWVVCPLPS